jgi:acyl dehydratase
VSAKRLEGLDAVRAAVGTHLGYSDWHEITAVQLAQFAVVTGHEDATYLVLSLTNLLLPQVVEVTGISMGVNYGSGAVRFPTPVAVGSRIRAGVELRQVDEVAGGVQTTMLVTVELEGGDEPACVVESVSRYLA